MSFYETYYSTLEESPYFKNLVEGGMANSQLVNGSIFIDRSGALFSHILQCLRTRKVFVGDNTLLLQLNVEAELFQLNQLGEAIQQRLDTLESEGKEMYRFMNLGELECIHLNKSPTTLSSAVESHQQEMFKVINAVDRYVFACLHISQ